MIIANRCRLAAAVTMVPTAVAAALLWVAFAAPAKAGPGQVMHTAAAPPASRPASQPRSPSTWHEVRDARLAYNRATLSGAYKAHGKHGKWDDDAVKFLDRMAVYFSNAGMPSIYNTKGAPKGPKDLLPAGKALVDDGGCDDPIVRYCYGVLLHDSGKDLAAAKRHVSAAVDELEKDGYPPNRVSAAAARLCRLDPDARARLKPVLLAQWIKMSCGQLDDMRRRLVFGHIWPELENAPRADQVAFLDELRKHADADPWVRDTIAGHVEVLLAWDSRGGGWANTVTPEGWQGFFDHLTRARDALTAAYNLAPANPEAPTEMITVAMGGSDKLNENITTWFQHAEAAQLDYIEAYDRMFNALLPRWGGNYGQIYALGAHAAQTGRFDTEAPWQLVRAVQAIINDSGQSWEQSLAKPGVYGALADVARGYATEAAKKDPERAAWYTAFRAALAWRAKKFADARQFLDKVPDPIDPSAFQRVGSQDPPAAIGHIYAMSSPHAAEVKKAEEALQAEKFAEAEAALRPISTAADLPPRMKPYLDARLGLISRRLKFEHGEWVDIQPDKTLARWRARYGRWAADDQGYLFNQASSARTPAILYTEPVGERFELSVVMEPYEHDGLPRGFPGLALGSRATPTCFIAIGLGNIWIMPLDQQPEHIQTELLNNLDGPIAVVMTCDGGRVSLTVNGKLVLDKHPVPPQLLTDARVGLIAQAGRCSRYSKIKIRKLPDAAEKQAQ